MRDLQPCAAMTGEHAPFPGASVPAAAAIRVDLDAFTAYSGDQVVPLTKLEFDLLLYLMRHASRVVSAQEIVEHVAGSIYRKESSLVRVHVAHLRKKLGLNAIAITTIRGRGFRFTPVSNNLTTC
jgi:DNA-binding response OmpR family regulator